MSWKTTLYDYVHHKNQMAMDYSIEPLLPFVSDTQYLQTQIKLLARRAHSDQDRRFIPSKNETRLTIIHATEQPENITAHIKLSRTSVGTIGMDEYEEQRMEAERIQMEQVDGKWYIAHIESLGLERTPISVNANLEYFSKNAIYTNDGSSRIPSQPYLNYTVLPYLEPITRKKAYNRYNVVQYAELWWERPNPEYIEFEVDCSNFVSQCLFAGGAPMNYTGKRDSGWWYKGRYNGQELWSFSWAVAQSLQMYLIHNKHGLQAEYVSHPGQLELGDVISYDWDGDGRFTHSSVVTALDGNGMPLVNAHTANSRHRYWSYPDSPSWTERTQYRFLHIPDLM